MLILQLWRSLFKQFSERKKINIPMSNAAGVVVDAVLV